VTTTGAHEWVADLYDDYVTATADIPFFVDEVRRAGGPVLELMAGTGRISLPLARARARLTCVDLSGPMLNRLRAKLAAEGLRADVYEMDVCELNLAERAFVLALLPFQSFAELLTLPDQQHALTGVAEHLAPGGRFICTLHNPAVRLRGVDGQLRLLGTFPLVDRARTLLLWSVQQRVPDSSLVRATQLYELYDADGRLAEKRWLDVRFRLAERAEFQALVEAAGFSVEALYGDYQRTPFDADTSPYMIWLLRKERRP
jgi:SAM-dependent methyltransferase